MRWFALIAVGVAILGFAPTGAEEPKTKPAEPAGINPRIVPVLVIKPGETKEMMLSTSCALVTRGYGLHFRDLKDGKYVRQDEGKVWKQDGLTVEFDSTADQTYKTGKDKVAAVAERGLQLFTVKVTAAADAKPGLIELHVADSTCAGTCETDFRILIVAK